MADTSTDAADGALDAVSDVGRLRALAGTGLSDAPDDGMEFIARWTRRALGVPLAMVSLVQADRQIVPGLSAEPGVPAFSRTAVPSWEMCRHVVATASPVVIADTRLDPATRTHPDTGAAAVGYAAMPLRDGHGHVLGALAAVDHRPRHWDDAALSTLADLARVCETDLRLRLARAAAARETDRHDRIEDAQTRALDRSQMLLAASQAFTDTETLDDVRDRTDELLRQELRPAFLTVVTLDRHGRAAPDRTGRAPTAAAAGLAETVLADLAAGRHGLRHHPDRRSVDVRDPQAGAHVRDLGLQCLVSAPLTTPSGALGAIVLGWDTPDAVSPTDLLTVATIAGFAAQAVTRARRLGHRTAVVREMQKAMLTTLPDRLGLPMAARYAPADARGHVGGDWYDAVVIDDPERPDDQVLALSVGDIVGHALPAVTTMGQARSMLRQATYDHPGDGPAAALDAFERANTNLQLGAAGTLIATHLRCPPTGPCTLTWTNAGHPPPVLLLPDGGVELLDEHDPLFGFGLTVPGERTDHRRELTAGTVLFLYTDGLVERRGQDFDQGVEQLLDHLRRVRDEPPGRIVNSAVDELASSATDDVVAFAVRIPPDGSPLRGRSGAGHEPAATRAGRSSNPR